MRNRTRPAIVRLMLRKHFEIAGWAAEHYQSLVVSASSERYPSQMVLWELCLSLKLQTLSSSTLCGDQWLILGRTLQSYANLKEKRCSSMSLLPFLSWWHCNNIGWVLRKETFRNSWCSNHCSSTFSFHSYFLNLNSPTSKTPAFLISTRLLLFQLSHWFSLLGAHTPYSCTH